ncbi:SusE outer membrane protein [Polaribacter sp. Hel1_33_78]|uniref:SusE domain-containing protein n=1 Tax=Polaribacter sp. Hel1_33_78 TaxID=1336804 RepID=UPI00087D89B9|nr:SusE domain-containing protein [Polaribacter sp. Hel1_33_78]SDT96719.1 SusE outer membrane protein [Polaribacter sp. Hel1_33_78]
MKTKINNMKSRLKITISFIIVIVTLISCTDNNDDLTAIAPTDGQLLINPSVTDIVLTKPNKAEIAITFNWNKPNYGIATPISYTLEIDDIDGDFSNPETEITENTELSLTHAKLNAIALSMDLATDVSGQLKVRLKSSLNYGSLPSYSKVETITVTPFLDLFYDLPLPNQLYLQGNAVPSNWGYPIPVDQQMTKNGNTFSIIRELAGGKNIAFLSSNTGWGDPAYLGLVANQPTEGGSFVPNMAPDWIGNGIVTPPITGIYKVVINFVTGKYSVTPQ